MGRVDKRGEVRAAGKDEGRWWGRDGARKGGRECYVARNKVACVSLI